MEVTPRNKGKFRSPLLEQTAGPKTSGAATDVSLLDGILPVQTTA